jgi:hypothetical protein
LHRRIEEALLDKFATATSEPELLAHHFTQAGMNEAAVEWWVKRDSVLGGMSREQSTVQRSQKLQGITTMKSVSSPVSVLNS